MSTARAYKFTTTASTNLQPVSASQASTLKSVVYVNPSTTVVNYLKVYWTGNTNATPVVGTTVPVMTLQLNASTTAALGGGLYNFENGVTMPGQLWAAVTALSTDADTTAANAGVLITLCVE